MKERKVRVFISSTFMDMNEERDYFNLYVFPQLKQYCDERYIEFTPIDLRWGITEEVRRNGLVIASCMEEVDNSRPFFVGILGGRYGWMPDIDDLNCARPVISQNQEWLLSMLTASSSITEIEMDYAALDKNNLAHALFFIKADDVKLPEAFREKDNSIASKKLLQLKQKIRRQQKYPVYTYRTPKEIGDILFRSLKQMIDEEFPPSRDDYKSSVFTRHEYALQSHALSLFSVKKDTDKDIQEWTNRKTRRFFITGNPGIGTSNRLAHLVLRLRDAWKSHELTDHERIVYYDFECATQGVGYFDDFMQFLSLIQDPIRIIAIDNASLLDVEDAERLWAWVRSQDTMIVMAATSSPFADMMRVMSEGCTVTMHSLTPEQSRSLLVNYPKMYGKQLTEKQMETIMGCKFVGDPTLLTLLLSALVRFGSLEQLDNRIQELIQWNNVFGKLIQEYEKTFNENKLALCFDEALMAIAMHGAKGIAESDLVASLSLSPADWAIIRPTVLQFCHNNTQRLSFIKISGHHNWIQEVKNCFSTPWIASVGCRIADYWWNQKGRDKEKYTAILSIYGYIWHLPYDDIEQEFKLLLNRVKSILLSPKTVLLLPITQIGHWYPHFKRICSMHLYDQPSVLIGKPIEQLSVSEKEQYYLRLARIASDTVFQSPNRNEIESMNDEEAWCYRQLAKIHSDAHASMMYEAKALLAEQKAKQAIAMVSTFFGGVKGTPKEQFDKRMIRLEASLQINYMDKYISEIDKLSELVEKEDINDGIIPFCTLISHACYQMMIYGVTSARKEAIEFLGKIADVDEEVELTNPFNYYNQMTYALYALRNRDWEHLYKWACQAETYAFYTFGGSSYQRGRTDILINYAYVQVNGKPVDSHSPYITFKPQPYEQGVQKEDAFYRNLVNEMNDIIIKNNKK